MTAKQVVKALIPVKGRNKQMAFSRFLSFHLFLVLSRPQNKGIHPNAGPSYRDSPGGPRPTGLFPGNQFFPPGFAHMAGNFSSVSLVYEPPPYPRLSFPFPLTASTTIFLVDHVDIHSFISNPLI